MVQAFPVELPVYLDAFTTSVGRYKDLSVGIWLCFVELLCATVPNDVNAGKNPSPSPSYDPNNNGSATIASGTDLYCYECSETYDSSFDPNQAPCLNNLSQITIRKCSYADNYCQVCRLLGFLPL